MLWAWHPGKATSILSTITTRDIKINMVFKTPVLTTVSITKDCQFLNNPNYKQAIDLDAFLTMNCCLHGDKVYCDVHIRPYPNQHT